MILNIKIDTTLEAISKPEDKNNSSNNSFTHYEEPGTRSCPYSNGYLT